MQYAVVHELYLNLMAEHFPVMQQEVVEALRPGPGKRFLDATFGGGGHTRALLDAAPGVCVTAFDCDPEARARVSAVSADFPGCLRFVDANFARIAELDEKDFDGALFDLGVSSFQLDTPDRGFSFRASAPADMRLDPRSGISAAEFLETAPLPDLVRAIRDYGEEPYWRRVIEAIVNARGSGQLQDTLSLASLIERAIPRKYGPPSRIHPATLSFQGIRIAVNEELQSIETALPAAFERLRPGGIMAVISFHSLEDRIVKRFMRRAAGMPETTDDDTPKDLRDARAELVTRKPIRATDAELLLNPRSRSAKLRVLRKF